MYTIIWINRYFCFLPKTASEGLQEMVTIFAVVLQEVCKLANEFTTSLITKAVRLEG